jgi:predicted nucleic-acid-binding Zn-ribbon protein
VRHTGRRKEGVDRVPLSPTQRQVLERWMHSKAIVHCPACGEDRWRFAEAAYLRALLEAGEADLAEDKGVVKISCDNCGYVALFDAETLDIRGAWADSRNL